jgi:hypothetical protein
MADIALNVLTGGDDSLLDPLCRNMIRAGALEGALYFATENTDGDIAQDMSRLVGVTVWFGPGRTFNSRCN